VVRPKFCQFGGAGNLACSRLSGGFFGHARVFDPRKRRLKAGGWSFYIFR
jgi:hypothetical protein